MGQVLLPKLDWYIGECMVLIMKITHGINKRTHGHQNCITNRMLIFCGYVKVREYLYTQVIIQVNTILSHIDTRGVLHRYKSSCMVYRSNWYRK